MNLAKVSANLTGDLRLLTVNETRERLGGICRNTLLKLESSDELVPVRIDRRVFYRSNDIEGFILGQSLARPSQGIIDHLEFLVSVDGLVRGISFAGVTRSSALETASEEE